MIRNRLPEWCTVLNVGSPGIGALEFNISLVKDHLEKGEPVVFITADMDAGSVISFMGKFGIDVDSALGSYLFLIDYHTSLLGSFDNGGAEHRCDVHYVVDLEGIMFNIDAISQKVGGPLKIFLHSLSTLFLYNQPNVVLKFFQIFSSRIRTQYGSAIFTLHEGVHEDHTVNHLMAISDGVIEMKFDQNLRRMMRIRHMRGYAVSSKWMPFEIKQVQESGEAKLLEWG
ncbi:MAG: RAD55 family ATPase [Methanomassiliicoccales archaeon]